MSTADEQDRSDGPPDPPPGNEAPQEERPGYAEPPREDEVSLLDLLLVLARNKAIIVRTVLVFTLLGVTYALLSPEQYTSDAKVVREAQQESGGLPSGIPGGALSGLGINLGGSASGLTPAAFPDVLQSREVRLAVVRDTFRFPDAERPMTYVDYVNRPPGPLGRVLDYTLFLPWTFKEMLERAISGPAIPPASTTGTGELIILSEEENNALKSIADKVVASVNEETGLMTISFTAGDPQLAATLTESFLDHLSERVREIRTQKVRERLQFVNERFKDAEKELEKTEDRLAEFLERNQNPTTASLQFRRDRLQRQVSFKEQLYSELQSQLTQTRLDLQRRKPVITIVEKPVPPIEPGNLGTAVVVFLSIIVGLIVGCTVILLKRLLYNRKNNEENYKKTKKIVNEIRTVNNIIG